MRADRWEVGDDRRLTAARERLGRDDYDARAVLEYSAADGWPADKAGRLLLALATFESITGEPSARATELVALMPQHLNAQGCFGPPVTGVIDEQQLAGHSWLVSGLLLHAHNRPSSPAAELARPIVDRLLLPGVEALDRYPVGGSANAAGAPTGGLHHESSGWRVSSDVYCVLIVLEGLFAAYRARPEPRIARAVERLVAFFASVDLAGSGAQLHASLTAARIALEYGELTDDPTMVTLAAGVYRLYAERARTISGATFNWFGRPDSWTEPCAIVDAAELAHGLWRLSGDARYLDDLHLLEHSALAHAQKSHGGFGLDTCAGASVPLGCVELEASWCCTMRGAMGLARLRAQTWRVDGELIHLDLPHDGSARLRVGSADIVLRLRTEYPASGRVSIELLTGDRAQVAVSSPTWTADRPDILLTRENPLAAFDIGMPRRTVVSDDGMARFRGPVLLGEVGGEEFPVGAAFEWSAADAMSRRLTVVHPR